jgi:F420-dependent oxidoreductase-like protein
MSRFPLRIDIKAAQHERDWENILRYCRDTEGEESLSGFWLFDHFVPLGGHVEGPCMDGWTLLAALAAVTERVRLGLMVGCNGYRHPAVLAKIATTVDRVSAGRLEVGLGAGWFELEYTMYGIPFPRPAVRIRQLDEACQVLKLLWTQETADFQGEHYNLSGARHEPKPVQQPHPPITIGGGGEQLTLRVVARHADIYNAPRGTPEEVRHKYDVLEGHCAKVGRDPAEIRRSWQVHLRSADEVEGLSERVQPYLDIGVDHVCVGLPTEYHAGLVKAIASEVKPLLG